jgi:xanthine/CO dehydrogenase XdhC/CoxF family maturation factor
MNPTRLLEFFESHKGRSEPLVLVTVYETEGSTYSKAGAQMLVNQSGVFRGMLSGGCLEGDLAIRASQVIETGEPQTVTYNLGDDDDELWGMGVGCDGLMRLFLQPLMPKDGYAPFAGIADILRGDVATEVTIPVSGEQGDLAVVVEPPPQVLIMGAGLDAEPVVRFAAELGWRCTVVDHRQAYIDNGEFAAATRTLCLPADDLGKELDLSRYRMAIVMSHHLSSDRSYLRQLAATQIDYVGLLGPRSRRDRLLDDLGEVAADLEPRLYGPAGLDLGGRGPEPIALSIIAQMQQELSSN